MNEEAIVDCEDPPEKRRNNFRMSKRLHTVCKSIDKALRKMFDSHKVKNLVDYAHKYFFDIAKVEKTNSKRDDLLLRKNFVDSILFRRRHKY